MHNVYYCIIRTWAQFKLWYIEAWLSVFSRDKGNWDIEHVVFGYHTDRSKFIAYSEQNWRAEFVDKRKRDSYFKIKGPFPGEEGIYILVMISTYL